MTALAIACAGCNGSDECRCLHDEVLAEEACDLVERAAEGKATQAALEGWLARHRQRLAEQDELRAARSHFEREHGTRKPATCIAALIGNHPFVSGRGSDRAIKAALREDFVKVTLDDMALARDYLAGRWLRPRPPTRARTAPGRKTAPRRICAGGAR